ncbi:MAG: fused MFS/spermidine synthase [Rhodocyclaceae bacterium]
MSDYPIDISEEAGVRYLHFGSDWVQGAMRIRRPIDLELAYTREMMSGLLMRDGARWPRRVLLIGLGAASLTKFCYWRLPDTKITVVEISPGVVAAARQFFKLPEEDARLSIVIGDGAEYIQRSRPHFDYILVDGYDDNARVGALDSLPFYQACRARLTDGGLLAANLFGRARKYKPALDRMSEAFDGRSLAFPSCDSGNVISFAATGAEVRVGLAELRERAVALKKDLNLDLRATVSRLEQAKTLAGADLVI